MTASDEVRLKRGWQPNPTIDNGVSEVELDSKEDWDIIFINEFGSLEELKQAVSQGLKPSVDLISTSI